MVKSGFRHHMVTIRDLARETGVSVATVSIVLNQAPKARKIPASTQKRIQEAAHRMGYSPNLVARSLRSRRAHNVGLLVFDITDPYCSLIVRGMEKSLYESGYTSVLTDLQNDPKRLSQCAQMLMEQRVGGVMAIANPLYFESELFEILSALKVPAVIVGRELRQSGFGSVVIENEAGTFAALQHLYQLGHRSIAYIRGPKALNDSEPRWAGLCKFASSVGLKIRSELVVEIQGRNSSYEEGYRLTQELITGRLKFTALVAFDDLTAFAAVGALAAAGLRVPQDCSVVGFDDIPGAAFYNPPLTTVHQYLEEQGELGGEMIKTMMRDSGRHSGAEYKKVRPDLVVRRSTAPVSKS